MSKMISSFQIEKEMTFKFENKFYKCIELTFISEGIFSRKINHAKVVAKRLMDGAIVEMTFYRNESVEQIDLIESKMIFMYDDVNLCFMDPDNYDMIEVSNTKFGWEKYFLTANLDVSCLVYENEIIKMSLPDEVCLTLSS